MLTYDGKVITAYFFSTSGGHTENVENIFGGDPQPYLVGVDDRFDDISPAPPLEQALLHARRWTPAWARPAATAGSA